MAFVDSGEIECRLKFYFGGKPSFDL